MPGDGRTVYYLAVAHLLAFMSGPDPHAQVREGEGGRRGGGGGEGEGEGGREGEGRGGGGGGAVMYRRGIIAPR